MNYKLIALDMDGTLLDSEKKISEKTYQSLKKASLKGVKVCLSTGRGFAELKDYKEKMDILSYGILISGGCIYDFTKNTIIHYKELKKDDIKEIVNVVDERDIMVQVLTSQDSVVQKDQVTHMNDYQMGIYQDMYERVTFKVEDIKDYILHTQDIIHKINLYHRTPKERERSYQMLKDLPFTLDFAEETSLEVTPQGIDKGAGLRYLADYLNIPIEKTIAIGDADNDVNILKTAGLSVAMGNANDKVKKIANIITEDNDHDGIKSIVEKYL